MDSRTVNKYRKDRDDIQEIPMGIYLDHKRNYREQVDIGENSMSVKRVILGLICFQYQMRVQEIMCLSLKIERTIIKKAQVVQDLVCKYRKGSRKRKREN